MVISRKEFASNMDENIVKIVKFLAENKDKAFTDKEIAEKLKTDLRTTFLTLVDMKMHGVIVGKSIGGSYYYSVTDHIATKLESGEFDLSEILRPRLEPSTDDDITRYIG